MAAAPSRLDQARSGAGAPRASCSVSLIRSLLSRAKPSSAASGPARLVLPDPGAPETSTTCRPKATIGGSAQPFGHIEGLAHSTPDGLRVLAVGERLVHGPVPQSGQDPVLCHALRVRPAELRAPPLPELRETHRPPATP